MRRCFRHLAGLVALILSLDGSAQTAAQASYSVSSESWVPYWIINDSRPSGILHDVLEEIDRRIPVQLNPIEPLPVKRAKLLFKAGDIQIECCINMAWRDDPEEQAVNLWSDTVMFAEEMLIFPKGKPFPYSDIEDLKGKQLATILGYGYIGDEYFVRNDTVKNTSLIQMVAAGRVDGGFMDTLEYAYVVKHIATMRNVEEFIESGPIINRSELKIRVHRSRAELIPMINQALAEMHADGVIDEIRARYSR